MGSSVRKTKGGIRVHVTKSADYALRAMLELASVHGASLKAEQIARALDVPRGSLENILMELRRAGLVVAQRGSGGGYRLARDPHQISLAEVLRVVDGPLVTVCGLPPAIVTYSGTATNLRDAWMSVERALAVVLEKASLADVDRGSFPTHLTAGALETTRSRLAESHRRFTMQQPQCAYSTTLHTSLGC